LVEARTGHVAVLLADGGVLIAGGHAPGDQVLGSAELRGSASGTWAATTAMTTPRAGASAVRLNDGRILVVGGWTGSGVTGGAEIWDPASEVWNATGSLAHPRAGHEAVLLDDGRVLVVGGGSSMTGFAALAERFDPTTGSWSAAGALSLGRQHLSVTRLPDGSVLAAGGDAEGDLGVTLCERWDPSTTTWSLTGPLSTERSHDEAGGFASTLLGDGRVLVAGGVRLDGAMDYLSSAEVYRPSTGSWAPVPPFPGVGRVHPAAVTLDDGNGLVVGGWTGDVALGDTFRFDAATDTWATLASLNTPRAGHTATALPNGDVVVVGGFTPDLGGLAATSERLVRHAGCLWRPR
jgi:N-acetylneuraminic acid mutarotase